MSDEKKSLAEKIRSDIEQEILSGKLPGGSHIDEQQLIERFGVSRTPAREALIQLAAVDLLTLVPRQGAFVKRISLEEYISFNEILLQLEALAAQLSARRMSHEQREQLKNAYEDCVLAEQDNSSNAYREANDRFHGLLYIGSGNEILSRQIRNIRARQRGMHDFRFQSPTRVRASLAEHKAVLDAVLAGDELGASRAMMSHIAAGRDVYAGLTGAAVAK